MNYENPLLMVRKVHVDIRFPTFRTPVNNSLNEAKCVDKFPTTDNCINVNNTADLSDRKSIIVFQYTRQFV